MQAGFEVVHGLFVDGARQHRPEQRLGRLTHDVGGLSYRATVRPLATRPRGVPTRQDELNAKFATPHSLVPGTRDQAASGAWAA